MNHYQIRDSDAATNHHPVDDIEPIEDPRHALADAWIRVAAWQGSTMTKSAMSARVMMLMCGLRILPKDYTYEDIAKASGLTRAAISLIGQELEDQFGLSTYNRRTERNRERCRKAQKSRSK